MVLRKVYTIGVVILLFLLTACGSGTKREPVALTPKDAVELATIWAETGNTVLAGGTYEEGEYKTFTHNGIEYRFLAEHVNTKKKLKSELHKYVTKKKAKRFMKENGFIKHEGIMAQPVVEISSVLQWEIATASVLKSKKKKMTFELTVPIGETRTAETFHVTYKYVKKAGWRIDAFTE